MTSWIVTRCAVGDAADLARNNMSAFWEDPTWKLLWPKDMTEEFIIEQCTKRVPRNLLRERVTLRHQKAIDPETGALMGYARWVLPESRTVKTSGEPEWAEAQVLDVGADEKEKIESSFQSAWWEPRGDMDALDDKNHVVMDRIRSEKPYICVSFRPSPLRQASR